MKLPAFPASLDRWRFPALALAFALLTLYLGYFADRTQFPSFITGYGVFFGLYIWVCFYQQSISTKHLIALGIALRVLLLFSIPNLSDDYVRFLWDGRLTVAGYHPFLHPPSYFIENHILPRGISPELFSKLNSPNYFTVYPPVCQAVFAVAAWMAPENDWLGVVVIKLFLLACEIGTIGLLRISDCGLGIDTTVKPGLIHLAVSIRIPQSKNPQSDQINRAAQPTAIHPAVSIPNPQSPIRNQNSEIAALYALNPLILFEIVGNCHFEGAMIFFLVAGILAMRQGQLAKSASLWALATASKMLPVLFLPIVWRWLGWRKGLIFNVLFGVVTVMLFTPLIAVLPNIAQSLDLYFREFQFNASIYYVIREVGYSKIGWDIGEFSGPRLGVVAAVCVLLIALFTGRKKGNGDTKLATAMLFALFVYLSFAAVVEPWYVCVPLAISLLTRWRFVVLWSGLVALSYSHYDGGLRQEHFGLIGLEYAGVWGFLIAEFRLRIAD